MLDLETDMVNRPRAVCGLCAAAALAVKTCLIPSIRTRQPCVCDRTCARAKQIRTPIPPQSLPPGSHGNHQMVCIHGVRSCTIAPPAVLMCELSRPMWYLPCCDVKGDRVSAAAE